MTTNEQWMLLTASEDGNPVRLLDSAKLAQVLANPGDWGIDRFVDFTGLPVDQNYWPSDIGVLLRYGVVIPVPSGAYQLPPEVITLERVYDPFRLGGVGSSPLKLGDVVE